MNAGRTGFTTGTCAAAAAKAAMVVLCGLEPPQEIEVTLPDGARVRLPVQRAEGDTTAAQAAIRKDAGDDPDVTDGCLVEASVTWQVDGDVSIAAGAGVGMVTKPGLSTAVGEPAINPVPRKMIRSSVRELTERGVSVTISIPGGEQLAEKTFNPRLGVVGGLSILGTSGIVRPFSSSALRDSLKCTLDVAVACKVRSPVFVPGRIGERAGRRHFRLAPEQLVEVSNEWGFMVDLAANLDFERLLVCGHPGKLAKLWLGEWDTHSSRSHSAVPGVRQLGQELLDREIPESRTVEGMLLSLPTSDRELLGNELADRIRDAVWRRVNERFPVSVVLVNMSGEMVGVAGELAAWG